MELPPVPHICFHRSSRLTLHESKHHSGRTPIGESGERESLAPLLVTLRFELDAVVGHLRATLHRNASIRADDTPRALSQASIRYNDCSCPSCPSCPPCFFPPLERAFGLNRLLRSCDGDGDEF